VVQPIRQTGVRLDPYTAAEPAVDEQVHPRAGAHRAAEQKVGQPDQLVDGGHPAAGSVGLEPTHLVGDLRDVDAMIDLWSRRIIGPDGCAVRDWVGLGLLAVPGMLSSVNSNLLKPGRLLAAGLAVSAVVSGSSPRWVSALVV
jgi:hypothetical protein